MRGFIALVILAFTISLAVVVGNRLTSEATAVVVGVVCGVVAGLPASVLLLIAVRRLGQRSDAPAAGHQPPYPPVIVINPNASPPQTEINPFAEPPLPPGGYLPRKFRIIGEEDEEG